jgi:murein DD-endopeptidase MepM/ murein hydrolase activator NlpD
MRAMSTFKRLGAVARLGIAFAGATALAGCSSDSQRFQSLFASAQPVQLGQPMPAGVDGTTTASINGPAIPRPGLELGGVAPIGRQVNQTQLYQPSVQQQVYRPQVQQPALRQPALSGGNLAPVAVNRQPLANPVRAAVEPISIPKAQPLPQVAAVPVAPRLAPVALRKPAVDTGTTGSVAAAAPQPSAPVDVQRQGGWSAVNGTRVVMREGETVYNLSRRFGVPASEILRVNGIPAAGAVQTGQELIIPTYQYSAEAGVSAPDANPETAMAKGSRGTIYDIPADRVPLPTPRPDGQVAVLPTVPQVKTRSTGALDTMAVGAVASQKPVDGTAGLKAVAGNPDQPLAAPVLQGDGRYKVVSGDSLHAIARKTGVSVGQLRAANGLSENAVLKVGQILTLPTSTVTSAGVDGVDGTVIGTRKPLSSKTGATDQTVTASIQPQQAKAPAAPTTAKPVAPTALRWPVQGKVSTAFRAPDNGKPNDGIDIAVPAGTPVKAAEGGTVIYSGNGLAEFGNTVLIRHDNGLVTVYGHADKLNVQRGQRVEKGQVIALSGASGKAGDPKLHFEVRKNSIPVDPSTYLQ